MQCMDSNPAIWFHDFIVLQARSAFEPMSHLRRLFYILPFALGAVAGAFSQNPWEIFCWMAPVFVLVCYGWGNENREWANELIRDFVSSILCSVGFVVVQARNILGFLSRTLPVSEYPPRGCRT